MFRIPLVLSADANTPPFEAVWDWATAIRKQSSSRRLTHAVWKKGCGRLRLRWGNKAWEAAELTRIGRSLTGLVAEFSHEISRPKNILRRSPINTYKLIGVSV